MTDLDSRLIVIIIRSNARRLNRHGRKDDRNQHDGSRKVGKGLYCHWSLLLSVVIEMPGFPEEGSEPAGRFSLVFQLGPGRGARIVHPHSTPEWRIVNNDDKHAKLASSVRLLKNLNHETKQPGQWQLLQSGLLTTVRRLFASQANGKRMLVLTRFVRSR
jgi:hypothetical protein